MFPDFSLGEVHIDLGRSGEHFRSASGVLDDEMGHYAVSCHFVKPARHEVVELLVGGILYEVRAGFELVCHGLYTCKQRFHFLGTFYLLVLAESGEIGTVGHITDGGYGLELCRSFVDAGDTCVAVDALACIFKHESASSVHLDAVVSVLVRIFGVHTLCKRCESVGQSGVFLLFLALFRGELALACDVVEGLVDVHIA